MNIEENRLRTFENWPQDAKIESFRVAKAGFFATGNNLEVQCHWCEKKISDWNYGDQAMSRHRSLNPMCTFVLNPTESNNVPIQPQTLQPQLEENPMVDLKNEQSRLATFINWPVNFISPLSLARAGFYYFDMADQVKCAWCQGIVGQWEINDNPYQEHQRLFPNCPKVQLLGPNIEIAVDGIQELGIQQIRAPKQAKYSSLDARIRTFSEWPRRDVQNPEILAQAGFYFQGLDDQVRCFHCNGGLRYWLVDDDPWFEHAKWFPKCQFVMLVKGEKYINDVQKIQLDSNSIEQITIHRNPSMTLDEAMSTEPVQISLQMGLYIGRIRLATKSQLEKTGKPFQNAESLVEAVLDGQFIEEEEQPSNDRASGNFSLPSVSIRTSRRESTLSGLENSNNENLNINHDHVSTNSNKNLSEAKSQSTDSNLNTDLKSSDDLTPEKISLEEENRKLKDARLCKVCMDGEVGVVFLPCGHLVTCVQCAPGVSICPLCRSSIKGFVRTFLS